MMDLQAQAAAALERHDAGQLGVVVVEDKAQLGAQLKVATANGVRAVQLGETAGPFTDLMALPRQVLKAMSAAQLRELARAPRLFVAQLQASAGQLREEAELEGGFHWHPRDGAGGPISGGGEHAHLFQIVKDANISDAFDLKAGMMLLTEDDGTHPHELFEGETGAESTKVDGPHRHRIVILAGETELELWTTVGGEHAHGLMVSRSGVDAPHVHDLELPDGSKLRSLTIAEFIALDAGPPADVPGVTGGGVTTMRDPGEAGTDAIDAPK